MFLDDNGRCDQPMVVDKDSAIYRITISGVPFNEEDLFEKRINGFRYDITLKDGRTKYDAKAYPLCGAEYKEGVNSVSLVPRPVTFLWKGPVEDGSHETEVRITQIAYNFKDKMEKTVAKADVEMPKASRDLEGKYEVILEPAGEIIQTYRNGVCAAPFKVVLKKDQKIVKDKEIYNSLFFCQRSRAGSTMPVVVGADPGDLYQNAILPADKVEVKNGKPIYHLGDPIINYDEGKVFYLFSGHNNTANVIIDVCLMHESGRELAAQSLSIRTIPQDIQIGMSGEQNSNVSYRDIGFGDGSEISVPGKGFVDYVFTNKEKEGLSFIFPLLPEGVNERPLLKRYDFSTFLAGFYLIPPDNYEREKVTKLKVTDRTATLQNTWDQDIYGYMFDIHGRHNEGSLFHDNKELYTREGQVKWKLNTSWPMEVSYICVQCGADPDMRVLVNIANHFNKPKLVMVHNDEPKWSHFLYDTYLIVGSWLCKETQMALPLCGKLQEVSSTVKVNDISAPIIDRTSPSDMIESKILHNALDTIKMTINENIECKKDVNFFEYIALDHNNITILAITHHITNKPVQIKDSKCKDQITEVMTNKGTGQIGNSSTWWRWY